MALTTPRKSAPYIPSWPLIPPEEPCVRFFLLEWNATNPTNAGSMQEEKKRVMQVWNEMKEEDKEVYYKEYEQDLSIYWRMQMVICGCHTCRQAIQSHNSILDVTHFVNKLKQSKDRNIFHSKERQQPKIGMNSIPHGAQVKQNLVSTCEVIAKSVNSVEQNIHTEELQQISQQSYKNSNEKCCETSKNMECKETMSVDFHSETCDTVEHSCLSENSYSKFVDEKNTQLINISPANNCKLSKSKNSKENSSEVSNLSVVTRGYPFTTTNCMDFSDNESDVSEEVSLQDLVVPTILLSDDRSSPIHQDSPGASCPSNTSAEFSTQLTSSTNSGLSVFPADSLLAVPSDSLLAVPSDSLLAVPSDSLLAVPSDSLLAVPSDSLLAVPSDSLLAVPSDSLLAVPSDSLLAVPSDSLLAVPSESLLAVPSDSLLAVPSDSFLAVPSESLSAVPSDSLSAVPSDSFISGIDTSHLQSISNTLSHSDKDQSITDFSSDSHFPEPLTSKDLQSATDISNSPVNLLTDSVNNVLLPDAVSCLPIPDGHLERSVPLNKEINDLKPNEVEYSDIKRITVEMILEKLRHLKSQEENPQVDGEKNLPDSTTMSEVDHSNNDIDSNWPDFVPIRNTLTQCTWEFFIENEARRNYNRKVTLKLQWNSKGGEPIRCVDNKGAILDIRSMQPFVRLKQLKSLTTPIVLKTCDNSPLSRIGKKRPPIFIRKSRLSSFHQFRSKENVIRLENKQVVDKPVVCKVCNVGFAKQETFRVHIASCSKPVHLKKHKALKSLFDCLPSQVDEDKNLTRIAQQCTLCTETFTDRVQLKIHLFTVHKARVLEHLPNRPYACSICPKRFKKKGHLVGHVWTHMPHRYKCRECRMSFPRPHILNGHIRKYHRTGVR